MANNRDLIQENRDLYEWIRDNGHNDFVSLASECDAFVAGQQWDPETKAKLSRRRKPSLTINRVLATVAALAGEHLVRRGDIAFRSTAGGDPRTAQAIDKLWMNFTHVQNYEWHEFMAFLDGVIRSRGFMDLRVDFDEAMQGEPKLTYINSKDVGLYPGDSGMDPDKWTGVLLSRWLPPRTIASIYDVKLDEVIRWADNTESDPDYVDWKKDSFGNPVYDHQIVTEDQRAKYRLLRVLERQEWEHVKVECFVDPRTGEVREIPDAWDNERIQLAIMQYGYSIIPRKVRKINWVVTAGELLLHNEISPYRHLTPIPYFPFVVGGKPIGIVEQLRDPQNLLNKTLSQELHIVAGIANSGYKVRQGALTNMTPEQLQDRGGEDGIVIEVAQSLGDVEKLQPNQVPTGLDRLSYKAAEAIQQISLVNDSMQGLNRADEAGRAIERKAAQGATALSPIYAALDQTRAIVARNWLDLVQQFITEERVYYVTNKARTAETQQVAVNQEQPDGSFLNDLTVGEYAVHVTNVQARDTYDLGQFDIMMQAMRQGAPIPWSDVINSLTILENRDEIVQFLKQQEGRTDTTEAQQQAEATNQRLTEAQEADKEASAQVKMAQAEKVRAEAGRSMQPDPTQQLKLQEMQQALEIKRAEMEMQMQREQQKIQLELQREQQKAQLEAQSAQQKMELERQKLQTLMEKERLAREAEQMKMQQELAFLKQKHELELANLRANISASIDQSEIKLEQQKEMNELKKEQIKAQAKQRVSNDQKKDS